MEASTNKYPQYWHHDILGALRQYVPLGDSKDMWSKN